MSKFKVGDYILNSTGEKYILLIKNRDKYSYFVEDNSLEYYINIEYIDENSILIKKEDIEIVKLLYL